jgi:tetratricopeptide (TPR) repeat protein
MGQWVEQFSSSIRQQLQSVKSRSGQIIGRNRTTRAATGLLLLGLVAIAVATVWQAHRANLMQANAPQPSGDEAHLRRINHHHQLDALASLTRPPEDKKEAATSDLRRERTDVFNSIGPAIQNDRDRSLEDQRVVPVTYEESAIPRDRTYRRTFPPTYPNPGGVIYLTSADPVALGPYAGDYLVLINKPQAALEAFRTRLAIDEQAVAVDPSNLQVQTDLAYSSSRIGDLLASMGDQAAAAPYYEQAVDVYTKTAAADPQQSLTTLQASRVLAKLARTHTSLGFIEKAWAESNKAVDLVESVPVDSTNVEQSRIRASAYAEIGDAYSQLANDTRTPQQVMKKLWTAAREMYERSFTILIVLRDKGVLNTDDFTRIDDITHNIAQSDLFLSK